MISVIVPAYNAEYSGYKFYKENPSLSLWETIKKILSDCGLE